MKLSILALLAITSASAFASPCSLNTQSIFVTPDEATTLKDEWVHYSKNEYKKYIAPNFSYRDCKNSIRLLRFKLKSTNEIYTGIFTNADTCDGGNSYGSVLLDGQVVGLIIDGIVSCE